MTSIPSITGKTGLPRRMNIVRPARPGAAAAAATHRERFVLPVAVLLAALIGIVGWLLLVSPLREDTAAAQAQAATVNQQVDTLRAQLADLQAQQADLPTFRAELEASQAALPTTAALPAFLRTLQDLGTSTGTSVTALDATEPDGSTGAASNGAAGVGPVYEVPITVTVSGSYDGLTAFTKALQANQPRAVLVDTISEAASDGKTTLTLSMTAFVAPTAGATGNGG